MLKNTRTKTTKGREEDLILLIERGATRREAAQVLGISKDSLNAWCRRTNNMHLYNKLLMNHRYHPKGYL